MQWWYNHTNPYTGHVEGDYRGAQIGIASPEQLFTSSGRVNTVNQGFDNTGGNGYRYYADVTCVSGGSGAFDFWVQPFQ
ncbi:MAG TPA: hypothetical protein VH419_12800 [Nocardioidaceae bacterium]|jgi:hypothetical protein